MYTRLKSNIISVNALGNCCKNAVPIIPVSRADILLLVDFSSHKKRKAGIVEPVLVVRDAQTCTHTIGHGVELLEGNVVAVSIDEGRFREHKLLKGFVAVRCSDEKNTRLVQHFILKLID